MGLKLGQLLLHSNDCNGKQLEAERACSFSMQALVALSLYTCLSSFKGEMPVLSCHNDLTYFKNCIVILPAHTFIQRGITMIRFCSAQLFLDYRFDTLKSNPVDLGFCCSHFLAELFFLIDEFPKLWH